MPVFDLKPSECHVSCQNLIGSYASTHSTFNLIGSCNRNPNTQSHKATEIHTLKPLTYKNSSKNNLSVKVNVHDVCVSPEESNNMLDIQFIDNPAALKSRIEGRKN